MSPPGAGRPRDPEIDDRIAAATRSLLEEGGFGAVTITAVAERAGVGRPTVYRRFPDRETLVVFVLYHEFDAQLSALAVPHEGPLLDQVVACVEPFLSWYASQRSLTRVFMQMVLFADTPLNEALRDQLFVWLGDIGARLQAAKDRGELRPDADILLLGYGVFSLYISTAMGLARGQVPDRSAAMQLFRSMLEVLLRGAAA